jgi:ABC-2 type transport system permease protein
VAAFALFVPSLLLGITIGIALDFIFSTLMVALDVALWVLNWLRMAVVALLSGAVLPLAILPWGLGEVFQWLPFASMASAPLLIYTGSGQPLFLVLTQIGWAAGLSLAAYWLWQRNRERLVGFGG